MPRNSNSFPNRAGWSLVKLQRFKDVDSIAETAGLTAAEAVTSYVGEHQIEYHLRPGSDLLVLAEVDEICHRSDVLVIVDVGQPFTKARAKSQVQPTQNPGAMSRHLLLSGPARVGEHPIGKSLSGQVPSARKEDVMILRPGAHRIHARFIRPILGERRFSEQNNCHQDEQSVAQGQAYDHGSHSRGGFFANIFQFA